MRMESQRLLAGLPVVLLLLLSSCATSIFTVHSTPLQADVFLINPKTGEKKSIGKTPVEMPAAAVKEIVGEEVMAGEYFTVMIEKPGFESWTLAVPSTRFGTMVTALDVKLKEGTGAKETRVAKQILEHLFLAQKLAIRGDYGQAQSEIDKILALAPDFSRALSMRGSIYYLQKNF